MDLEFETTSPFLLTNVVRKLRIISETKKLIGISVARVKGLAGDYRLRISVLGCLWLTKDFTTRIAHALGTVVCDVTWKSKKRVTTMAD